VSIAVMKMLELREEALAGMSEARQRAERECSSASCCIAVEHLEGLGLQKSDGTQEGWTLTTDWQGAAKVHGFRPRSHALRRNILERPIHIAAGRGVLQITQHRHERTELSGHSRQIVEVLPGMNPQSFTADIGSEGGRRYDRRGVKDSGDGIGKQRRGNAPRSKFCHICYQRNNLYGCSNYCSKGPSCRKMMCRRCLNEHWAVSDRDRTLILTTPQETLEKSLLCLHCLGRCPPKAQCIVYERSNRRRRMKKMSEGAQKPSDEIVLELNLTSVHAEQGST